MSPSLLCFTLLPRKGTICTDNVGSKEAVLFDCGVTCPWGVTDLDFVRELKIQISPMLLAE